MDEFVMHFTHTTEIDWLLPGVAPTGREVQVGTVAIVRFENDKLVHEHIYWDRASFLVQIGLFDPAKLPVVGAAAAAARKITDKTLPNNTLMRDKWSRGAAEPI